MDGFVTANEAPKDENIVIKVTRRHADWLKSMSKTYDGGLDVLESKVRLFEQANDANGVITQQKLDAMLKKMERFDALMKYIDAHTG